MLTKNKKQQKQKYNPKKVILNLKFFNKILQNAFLILLGVVSIFGSFAGFLNQDQEHNQSNNFNLFNNVQVVANSVVEGYSITTSKIVEAYISEESKMEEELNKNGCTNGAGEMNYHPDFYFCTGNEWSKKNLGQVRAYKVSGCTTPECTAGGAKYSECYKGICLKKTTTTTAGDATTYDVTSDGSKVTCTLQEKNVKVSSNGKRVDFNYTLRDCTRDGEPFRNPTFSCIAYKNLSNPNRRADFFCNRDGERTFVASDGSSIPFWNGSGCYAFRTTSGSVCIKYEDVDKVCGRGIGSALGGWIDGAAGTYDCKNATSIDALLTNEVFKDVAMNGVGVAGAGVASDDCKKAMEKAKKEGAETFECDGGRRKFKKEADGTWKDDLGTKIDDKGDVVNSSSSEVGNGLFENLMAAVLNIVLMIFDAIVFIFVQIAKGAFVLAGMIFVLIIRLNPASLEYLGVVGQIWGILAGLANLLIIAGLIFFGVSKVLGVGSGMTSSIGDVFLKMVIYALLLNFVFGLAILIINLGFGLGFLMIAARGGNPTDYWNTVDILVYSFINSLGGFTDSGSGGNDFIASSGAYLTMGIEKRIATFAGRLIELVVLGVGAYAFWKNFKVILFQRLRMFFNIGLSAITAALYFNPINKLREEGQKLFNRILIDAFFTPAYIGAIILASALVGALSSSVKGNVPTDVVGGEKGLVGSILTGLASSSGLIIVGAFAAGALWMIPDWFAKKYEDDMKMVGDLVKKGWEGAKNGLYKTGGLGRGVAFLAKRTPFVGKSIGKFIDKMDETAVKGNFFTKSLAKAGQFAGNMATGRTLLRWEEKAKALKEGIFGALGKIEEGDKKGIAEQERYKAAMALRSGPIGRLGGKYLADRVGLPYRGAGPDELKEYDLAEDLRKAYTRAFNSVSDTASRSADERRRSLRVAYRNAYRDALRVNSDTSSQEFRRALRDNLVNSDNFTDIAEEALKKRDEVTLQMILAMSQGAEAIRKALEDGNISDDEAIKNIIDNYPTLSDKFRDANGNIDKNEIFKRASRADWSPSNVDLMDPEFRQILREYYTQTGNKEKLATLNLYENGLTAAVNRANENLVTGWSTSSSYSPSMQDIRSVAQLDLDTLNINSDNIDSIIENTPELRAIADKAGIIDPNYNEEQREAMQRIRREAVQRAISQTKAVEAANQMTGAKETRLRALDEISQQGNRIVSDRTRITRAAGLAFTEGKIKAEIMNSLSLAGVDDRLAKGAAEKLFREITKSFEDQTYDPTQKIQQILARTAEESGAPTSDITSHSEYQAIQNKVTEFATNVHSDTVVNDWDRQTTNAGRENVDNLIENGKINEEILKTSEEISEEKKTITGNMNGI